LPPRNSIIQGKPGMSDFQLDHLNMPARDLP
jgi:hypothetical protein